MRTSEIRLSYVWPLILVLVIAGLFVLPRAGRSLQPAAAPNPLAEKGSDGKTIEQVIELQKQAWNRGDLLGFMEYYDHSPALTFFTGNQPKHGWLAALERYQQRYPNRLAMGQVDFRDLQIELLGPDAAYVRGRWFVTTEKEKADGLFTLVMKRKPEGWRIVHDHTSGGSGS